MNPPQARKHIQLTDRPPVRNPQIVVPSRRARSIDGVSSEAFTVQAVASKPSSQIKPKKPNVAPKKPHVIIRHRPQYAETQHALVKPAADTTHRKVARTANKAMKLSDHIERSKIADKKQKRKFRNLFSSQRFVVGLAALIILVSGYVTVDTWLTNRRVSAVESTQSKTTISNKNSTVHTDGAPDQTPLPKNALKEYKTAADTPRAVYIDKIGVAARALPMGVTKEGSLQAPVSAYDAGWYTGSMKPGETGAMLFDGHSSGSTERGAFGKLATLHVGDIITIETGDMTKYQYKVVAQETVAKDKVDMQKAMLPYGNSLQGANFITCAGQWTSDNKTMTERTVIYTVRV
jgi:sortase (surface protein transpeptidase)